jgi:uncharacterized Zn ribbon protein
MKIIDAIGNELSSGDAVSVKLDHVIGVIQKIDSGAIARGLILDGQPKGEALPPHIVIRIEATQAMLVQAPQGSPVGQVPEVVKVAKPASTGNGQ